AAELSASFGLELVPELGFLAEGLGNVELGGETGHGGAVKTRSLGGVVAVGMLRSAARPEVLL
ncbi:hypothetical protein FRC08_006484, partial [Ceratobasidium sp. 394]